MNTDIYIFMILSNMNSDNSDIQTSESIPTARGGRPCGHTPLAASVVLPLLTT
jgi:hypothetical protein